MAIYFPAVIVAAVVTYVVSTLYYSPLFVGGPLSAADQNFAEMPAPTLAKAGIDILRTFVVAIALAQVLRFVTPGASWLTAVAVGFWGWVAFSAMFWTGAVLWSGMKWQAAAMHSGDWLLKALIITSIVGAWHG